jgi:site-specific DNA-methyltransferase (adenine-specific)
MPRTDLNRRLVLMDGACYCSVMPGTFKLGQEDAVSWLGKLPDGSANLVVTDPPYESLEKHRAIGTTTRLKVSKASSNPWFRIFPNSRFDELFREVHRVLAKNAHFYLFCDAETAFIAKPIAESVGFKFWKPLIWDKRAIGMGYHYRARYEFILFFEKGKRRLNDLGVADVLEAKRIRGGYPTEKPVEVTDVLIRQSTSPGDLVVDPFMGSGSSGVAAVRSGRQFAGNDIADDAVALTRQRLMDAGALEQGALPVQTRTEIARVEVSQLRLITLDTATREGPQPARRSRIG